MDRILRLIAGRPWLTLLVLAFVTLLAGSQIVDPVTRELKLRIDPSTNRLLPENDDTRYYDRVRKLFGSDETMIVALHADDIFTSENLHRIRALTERIGSLPEVHHVVSLTNAQNIRGHEDGIDVRPFVTEIPEDPEALAAIREEALANPIYAGNLVSSDGATAALVIYFLDFSDAEFIEKGIDQRIAALAEEGAGDAEFYLAGGPHIKVAQYRYQKEDLQRAIPLMLGITALLLGLSFRTLRGMVVPLLTVITSLVWTLGAVAASGRPLNIVTVLLPALFAVLPLSYCVHVVAEYYESLRTSPEATSSEASLRALRRVWLPVFLTGVTTAAGFLAMILSPIGAIREFGVMAVVGILATVITSLTVPPVALGIWERLDGLLGRRKRVPAQDPERSPFARFANRAASFDLAHRRSIFLAAGAITVLALVYATNIQVGAEGVRSFPANSRIRHDFDQINRQLEGANLFNVVLEGETGIFREPRNLRILEELQDWLEAQPEIGGTTSMVQYLKLIHRGFFANDPDRFAIPPTRRLTTQLLFFGASDELEGFVDGNHRSANIVVRANVIDTELVSDLVERIEARLEQLPEALQAQVTGNPILVNRLFDDIVTGQARSVLAAFILIYGILWLMFLDWRTAAKALIPNFVPVAFYFGALGLSGTTLNFATSLIAPMALGIAIDDTIHYFSRFNEDAKRLADEHKATFRTLLTVGRPVTVTTIVLCVGFSVLIASELRTFVQFGALAALTLAFAWVVDFSLTPALCSGLRIVTLWDTLTLDLGEDPQNSIQVFRGLSNAQARIVAQMASLREVPAGASLMRKGDPGGDMFVVIEGRLQAWIDTQDGRRELNASTRGDVVGEVGLFTDAERTANIDVVDDARLLRLTQHNLERLRRRHPRIASTVFRNLNTFQAERLAKTTLLLQ